MKRQTARAIALLVGVAFWGVIGFIVIAVCNNCSGYFATDGYLQVNREVRPVERVDYSKEIIQLDDGSFVPEGYTLLQQADFVSGVITVNCSERYFKQQCIKLCRESGGDAFRIYDVKEPDNITNTCFQAKVLILKRK